MRYVYSKKIGARIAIARDMREARTVGFAEVAVYTEAEIRLLKGAPESLLRLCHDFKQIFEGFVVNIAPDRSSASRTAELETAGSVGGLRAGREEEEGESNRLPF